MITLKNLQNATLTTLSHGLPESTKMVRNLLKTFGANRVAELNPDQYEDFARALLVVAADVSAIVHDSFLDTVKKDLGS